MPKKKLSYSIEEFSFIIESIGMKYAAIEKAVGLSNGIIGKVIKGKGNLSDEKFNQLKEYCELKKTDRKLSEFASILSLKSVADGIQKQEATELPPKFNPKVEEIKSSIEGITTANKVSIPEKRIPQIGDDLKEKYSTSIFNEVWVTKIEDYCNKNGITPQDLIECHQNSLKSPKKASLKDISKAEEKTSTGSPKYDRRKVKLGF